MKTVCHARPTVQRPTPHGPIPTGVARPTVQELLTRPPRDPVSRFFALSLDRPTYTLKALPEAGGFRGFGSALLMLLIHRLKGSKGSKAPNGIFRALNNPLGYGWVSAGAIDA